MPPALHKMLPRSGDADFPGIPSTQEWREDFPATQFPTRKSRTAYITPQTSFNVPSDETEIDGFDIHKLLAAPQTPARGLTESHQMPPSPMSLTKGESSSQKYISSHNIPTVRADNELSETSTLESETLPASLTNHSSSTVKLEGAKVPRRRRRRTKKRNNTLQPSSSCDGHAAPDLIPSALRSTPPEPWPLPFPQADKGIYPYLPPAQQFDQMVKFTSATEEHIDKWDLHHATYPVPLLRQVLSAQECVHMGLYSQLEHMDKMLQELEKSMKPMAAKERTKRGKVGDKYRRVSPRMLSMIKFMRSVTKQEQVCFYESRIPTRPV